jgi:DNA-directed RNA polymerase specialized sigma24 family protein
MTGLLSDAEDLAQETFIQAFQELKSFRADARFSSWLYRIAVNRCLNFFASPEDTVLAKLEWFRKGGSVSDRQWRDLLGVLKVQAAALDRAYMVHWAGHLGVADLLQRALNEAGLSKPGKE